MLAPLTDHPVKNPRQPWAVVRQRRVAPRRSGRALSGSCPSAADRLDRDQRHGATVRRPGGLPHERSAPSRSASPARTSLRHRARLHQAGAARPARSSRWRSRSCARECATRPSFLGKHLGMIFEAASTRTRVSFENGFAELGGNALYLRPGEIHLPGRETIGDTARTLSPTSPTRSRYAARRTRPSTSWPARHRAGHQRHGRRPSPGAVDERRPRRSSSTRGAWPASRSPTSATRRTPATPSLPRSPSWA